MINPVFALLVLAAICVSLLTAGFLVLWLMEVFACGLGYYSFFRQLQSLRLGQPDPAPIPSEWVLLIKGIVWTLGYHRSGCELKRFA